MEKEFQAVKILLETGEFDNEMDIDEKKSNEASKNQENEKSRNINNIKMFIQKNENEQTPLKYSILNARNSEIMKRKQMLSTEFFKCKKKLRNLNSLTEGLTFRKSFSKAVMDPSKTFVNQIISYNSYLTTGAKLMNSNGWYIFGFIIIKLFTN